MNERPILFQGAMVRAILAGTKTQTRRVCKGQRELSNVHDFALDRCLFGKPGDRLWIKETYVAFGRWETRFDAKKARDTWHFIDMTLECGKAYRYATDVGGNGPRERGSVTPQWWKRPAIFMPRAASRIMLEITSVRVERLQEISDVDALAEGIEHYDVLTGGAAPAGFHVYTYRQLWERINGAGGWDLNPWVWAVSFRRPKP